MCDCVATGHKCHNGQMPDEKEILLAAVTAPRTTAQGWLDDEKEILLAAVTATRTTAQGWLEHRRLTEDCLRRWTAARDKALAKVQARCAKKIEGLQAALVTYDDRLHAWANGHRADFGEVKTLDLGAGVLKFRLGPSKLETLPGRTWAMVLERVIKRKAWRPYLIQDPKLDKTTLMADVRAGRLHEGKLKAVGLTVAQDEFFEVSTP